MIDAVASDYQEEITFLAVAGRSDIESSRRRVGDWFSPDRLRWGYDDTVWELYGVFGQPTSVLITGDDLVLDGWFGGVGEEALQAALDRLVAAG